MTNIPDSVLDILNAWEPTSDGFENTVTGHKLVMCVICLDLYNVSVLTNEGICPHCKRKGY